MKLLIKLSSLIIFVCLINTLGCKRSMYSSYYNKSAEEWGEYLNKISSGKIDTIKNTVLLVLTTNECSPSIDEIKKWSEFKNSGNVTNVEVIILEKYKTTLEVLIEQENINLPVYQDSSYKIIKSGLLPRTPMKVYIGENGKVKKLRRIGEDINPNDFISNSK